MAPFVKPRSYTLNIIVKSANASYNDMHMLTPELLEFIRAQQEAGMSREEVERLLLTEGGWTKSDVDQAFRSLAQAKEPPALSSVALPEEPVMSQPSSVTITPLIEGVTPTSAVSVEAFPAMAPVIQTPAVPVEATVALAKQEEFTPFVPVMITTPTPGIPQEAPAVVTIEQQVPSLLVVQEPFLASPIIAKEEPYIFVGSENPTPAPLVSAVSPVEEAPITVDDESHVVSVPPADDFLGLFGSLKSSSWQNHSAEHAPVISPSPLPFREVETPASKPQGSSISDILLGGVAPKVESAEVQPTSPFVLAPVVPSVPSEPDVLRNAPSPFAPLYQTKAGEEPASVFKFDFAKMRSVPLEQTGTPAAAGLTTEASPLDVSQLLKTESKDESMSMPIPGTPSAHETGSELSAPAGRRTMAGDLLLQGLVPPSPSGSTPVIPSPITPVSVPAVPSIEGHEEKSQITSMPVNVFGAPLAEEIKRKNTVKRLLGLAIGGIVLLTVIGGAIFLVLKFRAPDIQMIASGAFGKFFDATSFSYKGKGSADLLLSTATGGAEQTGIVKFDIDYEGSLDNGPLGYGNGAHRIKLAGGLQSGDFSWPAYLDADMRIFDSSLYFHLLSLPPDTNLDPELVRSYWIKVNLSEIAKELALSGMAAAQEGYGDFGGQIKDNNFNAMLKKHAPFEVSEQLPDDVINGVAVEHFKMKANGEAMLQFTTDVYKRSFGKDLVLTDDKHIRLRDGLAKMVGEIWTNKDTGELIQVSISGDLDDDMFDVHVRGRVSLFFGFFDLNKPVAVDVPSPTLTLEELKAQMDQYQRLKEVRSRDAEKVARLSGILRSLDAYKEAKGRFPTALNEMYGAGIIASSSIPTQILSQYEYESYVGKSVLLKANRCSLKGKVCAFYHIGTNLEEVENALLSTDADIIGDVRGADTAGCIGEKGFACYDVVTPVTGTSTPETPVSQIK